VRCGTGVPQVLIGVNRVGIARLKEVLREAAESGLTAREEIVNLLVEKLSTDNYIPASQAEAFRIAVWREYLRHKNEDFSEFYSQIDVTVRGEPGEERDAFVDVLRSVFAELELKPTVTFAPASDDGPNPQLIINDEVIVRGLRSRYSFKSAVHKSISGW
jgi:hypothetical protein